MKVLIIRFSSIGDIVLTTPVIRTLKQQTHAQIHYLTSARYRELLCANPYIDKLIAVEKGNKRQFIGTLRKERYDYIIDLHHNMRTFILKRLLWRSKSYSFRKLNIKKLLLVFLKWNRMPHIHVVDRYLRTVAPLGVVPDGKGLDYFLQEKDCVPLRTLPPAFRKGYVVYVVAAKYRTKCLPISQMIRLCENVALPMVLLGDKKDAEYIQPLTDFFQNASLGGKSKKMLWNACGKYRLSQSASLISQAQYVISHDTGLMHISAAFQKPIVSIWGSTVLDLGMYPYRTKFIALENKKLWCRPCSKIGYASCPLGHFKCMKELSLNTPINSLLPALSLPPPPSSPT